MSYRKLVFSTFSIILFLFLFSCSKVDTDWHRYQGRQAEGWEDPKNEKLKIISDGWKIIGKTEDKKYYEWGWEIVLIAPKEKEDTINEKQKEKNNPKTKFFFEATPIYCIKEIQYVLHDKDGFELVSDQNEVGARCFDLGKSETFRKTSFMSQSQANRAVKSSFRIVKD